MTVVMARARTPGHTPRNLASMAVLYYRTQTWIRFRSDDPLAAVVLCQNFTLPGDRFRFQSELPSRDMGSESESVSGNVNEPSQIQRSSTSWDMENPAVINPYCFTYLFHLVLIL